MQTLKYKIIKSKTQYKEYCRILEELIEKNLPVKAAKDEAELLTFLIEKWDQEHNTFNNADPVKLLESLMTENNLKAKDLVKILGVSKGLVSDILNYRKGLSKEVIRHLSAHFKVSQEAFNRPYKLKSPLNAYLKNASVMNTQKAMAEAI
jgi:HTH-type transcriptional regulator/antitoxin HigA